MEWSKPITVDEMYGDWDYDVAVELLEQSLSPRRALSIFDTVESLGVGPESVVLDIGGRDGFHALMMAERFGCRVMAVDPAPANIDEGLKRIAEHDHGSQVEIELGAIEEIPASDNEFDLVFSRDMLNHVADQDRGLAECVRVLKPGGAMVVHEVFETELMEPREAARLYADLACVPERMVADSFEDVAERAGFTIESLEMIGSEWYEASQEAGTAPNYALQISRLRRSKGELLEKLGEIPYRVMYGNALWSLYLFIGKLETRLYVLRAPQ